MISDRFFSGLVVRNIREAYSQKIQTEKLSLFSKIKSFIPIYNVIDFLLIPKIELSKKIVYLIMFLIVSALVSAIVAAPILLLVSFFSEVDLQLYFNIIKVLIYFFMSLCFIFGKNVFMDELVDWKYDEPLTKEDETLIRNQYGDEIFDLIVERYFEKKVLTYRDLSSFNNFIECITESYLKGEYHLN